MMTSCRFFILFNESFGLFSLNLFFQLVDIKTDVFLTFMFNQLFTVCLVGIVKLETREQCI